MLFQTRFRRSVVSARLFRQAANVCQRVRSREAVLDSPPHLVA
jgi:hypothetical protein